MTATPVLSGEHIRLEPLTEGHAAALAGLASADPELYRWTFVPHGSDAATSYVATALAWQAAGSAVPFATLRQSDDRVIGSTRFYGIERWTWPPGHPRHGRNDPDAAEIGYSWLAPDAIRTAANTEAKLLMLTHAFESWGALRICLHTDVRNIRSRAAMERPRRVSRRRRRASRPETSRRR